MGKVRTKSLRSSMVATFLVTICVIAVLSAVTIFVVNQLQQKILQNRYLTINSPDFRIDENTGNYIFDVDNNNITWQSLSTRDNIVYYGSYIAMLAGYLASLGYFLLNFLGNVSDANIFFLFSMEKGNYITKIYLLGWSLLMIAVTLIYVRKKRYC